MTGLPLLPAAVAATALSLVAAASPLAAPLLAIVVAIACAGLALASADRMRRLAWTAAAAIAVAHAVRIAIPELPAGGIGAFAELRASLGEPLRRLVPEPESGILLGVALGDRGSISADLAYAFSRSGTSHLLAISGFNMTLVASAVGALLRERCGPRARAIATVAAVVLYSLLVGLGASVVRSAVMAAITSLGLALGRRAAAANGLCAAIAIMQVVDPATIGDASFLLSAGATAGLLAFQAPLAKRLAWLPSLAGDGLAATLAATLPTLPIVAGIFGRISLVSPVANLVAVPLFPALMATSVATIAAGTVSLDLARPFALAAYAVAFTLRAVVETASGLPLAAVDVPPGPLTAALLLSASAAAVLAARRLRLPVPRFSPPALPRPSRRAIALALGPVLLAAALAAGLVATAAPPFRIRALDIGQGDAYLVEVGGRVALIDGGPDPARLLAELGASLPPWRRRIDLVALTHAHLDHGAGLVAVLDRYDVGLAVAPRGLNAGPLASAWNARIQSHHIARADVGIGSVVTLGPARIRVLAPNDDPLVDVPSLVLRLELGPVSVLFSGDATETAQADLLLAPGALRARVYVPPHHGAATPYASALVGAVHPEVALISAGLNNRYGHPTPDTLAALAGVATYRTDRDGTVELTMDGSRLVVHVHANGLPPPRPQGIPQLPR
ncbi:MAG TPA: ComEC/Rec2 family competence protein [Candidatus Saccharimonadales bacterium]|nr:ComEC/Rec2 family competence protein [Candidatus Saccharimonadales bacterium]